MVKLNHHYQKLKGNYLFAEIQKRVAASKKGAPSASYIHLGIGDVTQPLTPSAVAALKEASLEMGDSKTFQGYGPSQGYPFLREAIAENDYKNLKVSPEEIFISNGAKCDIGNFQELFDIDNRVALFDPTYPVYLDTTVMAGRSKALLKSGVYGGITYIPCTEENKFQPLPPASHVDLIYLCSPNNPTGVALTKPVLKKWVDYAREHSAVILFDGAYEAFIRSEAVPHSIYEIEGAHEVAVEIRSFSKSAGFTGLRCSYMVVPFGLKISDAGKLHSLHALWTRRHDTKFNGVPYPVQKAAWSLYTPQGKKEKKSLIAYYQKSADLLAKGIQDLGGTLYGGKDAPYLWWKTPSELTSWDFFDHLLEKGHLVTTPGSGFGLQGEGFVRLSAFGDAASIQEGLTRLKGLL